MTALVLPMDIPIELTREEAQRRAVEELAKAKYGAELPDWVQRLLERLGDFLQRIVELVLRITSNGSGGGGVSWGFLIIVALLVVAVALVIWKVGLPRWNKRTPDADLQLDSTRPPADYRERSEAAAAAGDWRAAVRDRYRAVIRELEIRTILQPRPARTAWEAAGSAARLLPDVRDDLFTGATVFNEVLYGDHPVGSGHYARLVEIDAAVLAAADRADLADAEQSTAGPTVGAGR